MGPREDPSDWADAMTLTDSGVEVVTLSRPRSEQDPREPSTLASIGSAGHSQRQCKPCLFLRSPVGCDSGADCLFCHLGHKPGKVRPCKNKRERYRRLIETRMQQERGLLDDGIGLQDSDDVGSRSEEAVDLEDTAPPFAFNLPEAAWLPHVAPDEAAADVVQPAVHAQDASEQGLHTKEDDIQAVSVGSKDHDKQMCKPCLFMRSPMGCGSGLNCQFCHLEHAAPSRARPCKSKRERYRKLLEARALQPHCGEKPLALESDDSHGDTPTWPPPSPCSIRPPPGLEAPMHLRDGPMPPTLLQAKAALPTAPLATWHPLFGRSCAEVAEPWGLHPLVSAEHRHVLTRLQV